MQNGALRLPNAQINAEEVIDILGVGFLYFARDQQIPCAPVEQQVAFTLPRLEHAALALTAHESHRLPPVERPDRDGRGEQCEREDAVIVGNSGERAKGTLGLLVPFVGITHFGECAHHHLRRQSEHVAHILITHLLKRKLAEHTRLPRHAADVIAGGVGGLKRTLQGVGLLGRWLQLQVCHKFHNLKYSTFER